VNRREFITLLCGAAAPSLLWPLAARAQQPAMPVIGFLSSGWQDQDMIRLEAFRLGLSEVGFVEGKNVEAHYRWSEGHNNRLAELAVDLVRRHVTVIAVLGGSPPALVAKTVTTTIPIVFSVSVDPVAAGLIASLNRPGGNLTGITSLGTELGPKQLELLRELLPAITAMALLINPNNVAVAETLPKIMHAAAKTKGIQLHVIRAGTVRELDAAFVEVLRLRVGGLVIATDGFFFSRSEQLAKLALRYAVPTMYQFRQFAAAGGLISYGGSLTDSYRLAGIYAGRILKGEKPVDLPVQQSTKVELFINLNTAKVLGLEVPLTLLARADEVIE
jgi:ABC-type uncharacterized transport system substrate-binding protein